MKIKESELILNSDGSIYHINLKPGQVAKTIILVGDQNRVEKVSKHFDTIEFSIQKREFKTCTGTYKGKRITVVSTGIGPDNIDIVLNEIDALFNIDLNTKQPKTELTSLNFIRIGTSGAIQADIPIDSFVLGSHGLDLNGMLHAYQIKTINNPEIEAAFSKYVNWSTDKANPLIIDNGKDLEKRLESSLTHKGITATTGGFYGPQGRVLRLPIQDTYFNNKLNTFNFKGLRIVNFEMETSAIYGLSKLLKHQAVSLNAIIANRALGTFSKNPYKTIDNLIAYTLNKLA
ncbi:MAG: nucleoside phosphorylase [Aestuariibaculum sp.]